MIVLNENALDEFVINLKKDGWNGDKEKLLSLMSSANENYNQNVFSENIFFKENDFLVCRNFIYKSTPIVDSFCNIYIKDKYLVIVEQENSYGSSVDNAFDSFIDVLQKTAPLSCENIKELEFIVKPTEFSPYKINYDFKDHWSSSNITFDIPFDLNSLN